MRPRNWSWSALYQLLEQEQPSPATANCGLRRKKLSGSPAAREADADGPAVERVRDEATLPFGCRGRRGGDRAAVEAAVVAGGVAEVGVAARRQVALRRQEVAHEAVRDQVHLVDVDHPEQVHALAADVVRLDHHAGAELLLHACRPLLHVRRDHVLRETSGRSPRLFGGVRWIVAGAFRYGTPFCGVTETPPWASGRRPPLSSSLSRTMVSCRRSRPSVARE